MAVINLTVEESSEQIVSGIPRIITIIANMPCTIFYTLDGTAPTIFSSVYINNIVMPTNQQSVTLSIFATNGIDSSDIITDIYQPNFSTLRMPHSRIDGQPTNANSDLFPFGSRLPSQPSVYKGTAAAGLTIDKPNIQNYPDGYDGQGNPSGGTDSPQPLIDYTYQFSTSDNIGQTYKGAGTMPSTTTVVGKVTPVEYTQEESNKTDKLFNPRALVIFQDASAETENDPVMINRQYFSLANQEIISDGVLLANTGPDTASVTGSFIRREYNSRTNEMTYYYRDTMTNRWIISKGQHIQPKADAGALYQMVFSRPSNSAGFVFTWPMFRYRRLI